MSFIKISGQWWVTALNPENILRESHKLFLTKFTSYMG